MLLFIVKEDNETELQKVDAKKGQPYVSFRITQQINNRLILATLSHSIIELIRCNIHTNMVYLQSESMERWMQWNVWCQQFLSFPH